MATLAGLEERDCSSYYSQSAEEVRPILLGCPFHSVISQQNHKHNILHTSMYLGTIIAPSQVGEKDLHHHHRSLSRQNRDRQVSSVNTMRIVILLLVWTYHFSAAFQVAPIGRVKRFSGFHKATTPTTPTIKIHSNTRLSPTKTATTTTTSTAMGASLQQYAPDAIRLFSNMALPASILGGSIVPMGFAAALPIKSPNEEENRPSWVLLRKAYNVAALLCLLSNLIAVMWSVITVNQLTETTIAPAESVWALLRRDFDLEWYVHVFGERRATLVCSILSNLIARLCLSNCSHTCRAAVNSHFLFGLLSYAFCIACRGFLQVQGGALGQSMMGFAGGALLMIVSVVNRAVSYGAGDGVHRYGANILGLFGRYLHLLVARVCDAKNFGILGLSSILLWTGSLYTAVRAMLKGEDHD